MLCHSIGKSLINILKTLEYFVTHWKPTFLKVISVQDTFPNQIHFFFPQTTKPVFIKRDALEYYFKISPIEKIKSLQLEKRIEVRSSLQWPTVF